MTGKCPMSLPVASGDVGLKVLQGLAKKRSMLAALEVMHEHVGDVFQITLPGFQPAFLVGPEANRQVLVADREQLLWRPEGDPVAHLLRHGLLVEDGQSHADLRQQMEPFLQRRQVIPHIDVMQMYTDRVLNTWEDGDSVDMLESMRELALLILIGTLFSTDFGPDMARLWQPILKTLKFISPGLWILWPNMPRPGYKEALRQVDEYLYGLVRARRIRDDKPDDLLTQLISQPNMDDELIRDQMLTMLIAGHDTSTALLAWTLYLLGTHPKMLTKAQTEVDQISQGKTISSQQLGQLDYLDQVIKESLRLYPPIHVGNRFAADDLTVQGYEISAGTRVMYSIYLSHRDAKHWHDPDQFMPERFGRHQQRGQRPPLTYVPFGGGPRNCIGAAFAQIEAKVVLARILQRFDLSLLPGQQIRPYMGATLEPRPGVRMRANRRRTTFSLPLAGSPASDRGIS